MIMLCGYFDLFSLTIIMELEVSTKLRKQIKPKIITLKSFRQRIVSISMHNFNSTCAPLKVNTSFHKLPYSSFVDYHLSGQRPCNFINISKFLKQIQ